MGKAGINNSVLLFIFCLRMENALRQIYPDMVLPYWDVTLEAELDVPRNSSLFSERFMGNGDGFVRTGPFSNWSVQDGYLYRTVGKRYSPMDDRNISVIFAQKYLSAISYPYADTSDENLTNYELVHNRVHNWVGGEMDRIETAADDPIFFIYHCFIDYVYEQFRAHQRANGVDPVTDWSIYYGAARHNRYSPMGIGNLMAIDGDSEVFARNIEYLQKPSCSRENPDCGTPYLWCNVTRERCVPWTIKEFLDMEYVAEQDGKPLLEEIKIHIEYRIQLEFEKIKQFETSTLPGLNSGNRTEDDSQLSKGLEYQENNDALVDVEIAMIVFTACLGCYAAFLITIKCITGKSGTRHKTANSYNINGNQNDIGVHNKPIPQNDIIAEITQDFVEPGCKKKEYNLHQASNGHSDVIRRVSFRDPDDQTSEERYVIRLDIKNDYIKEPFTTVECEPITEDHNSDCHVYENMSIPCEGTCKASIEETPNTMHDTKHVENRIEEVQIEKSGTDSDNTSLSGGIFTSLGSEFFPEERL